MVATPLSVELVNAAVWPIVVLVCVGVLFTKSGKDLLSRITHFKAPGGLEFDLQPENAGEVKVSLEKNFAEYRAVVKKRFDRLISQYDIVRLRDKIAEEIIRPTCRKDAEIRCVIYVRDVLLEDALYALTDYYPSGKEAGKVYSIRFGIIGRQWRLRKGVYEPSVDVERNTLVHNWGMTTVEAVKRTWYESCVVAMLKYKGMEQGLLFVGSNKKEAFGEDPIADKIEKSKYAARLGRRLELINEEMGRSAIRLRLFESDS
jgi:hypothetical protein